MIILASVFITLYLFEAYLIFKKQLTLNYIYKVKLEKI